MKSISIFLLTTLLLLNVYGLHTERPKCEVSIIGSGLSGVYSAYRLATAKDSPVRPWDICVFEGENRVGGRMLPLIHDRSREVLEMGIPHFDASKSPMFYELVQRMGIPTQCAYLSKDGTQGQQVGMNTGMQPRPTSQVFMSKRQAMQTTQQLLEQTQTQAQIGTQAQPTGTEGQQIHGQPPTEEQKEECGRALVKFFFMRNKIVYPNSTEELPFDIQNSAHTQGLGTQGTQAQGTQEVGTQGNQAQGTQGVEAQGTQGVGAQGTQGVEALGLEAQGNQAQGTQGVEAQGTQEVEAQGTQELGAQGTQAPQDLTQITGKRQGIVPDIAQIAFNAVYREIISSEDLDRLSEIQDREQKWSEIARLISQISQQNVTYRKVPVNQISVELVLRDVLNESEEFFKAAMLLSEKYEFLKEILEMNFEHFAHWYIRNKATESKPEDRVVQGFSGLKTILDVMIAEVKRMGVQFYVNSKLERIDSFDDGILLDIYGFDQPVFTRRLILAISLKNLRNFKNSQLLAEMSDEVSESLGSLKHFGLRNGVVFYDDAWWRNYDLSDQIVLTDTVLKRISFHDSIDCKEGQQKCSGYIRIKNWGDKANELGIDMINPIDISTVLSFLSSEGDQPMEILEPAGQRNVNQTGRPQNVNPQDLGTRGNQAQGTRGNQAQGTQEVQAQGTQEVQARGVQATQGLGDQGAQAKGNQAQGTQGFQAQGFQAEGTQELGGLNETLLLGDSEEIKPEEEFIMKHEKIYRDRSKLLLSVIHKTILNIFEAVPGFNGANINAPRYSIWANWDDDSVFKYGVIAKPSKINLKTFTSSLSEPIPGKSIHLVNSDFTELAIYDHGLESSLINVERTLSKLGMSKPEWYTPSIYTAQVNPQL